MKLEKLKFKIKPQKYGCWLGDNLLFIILGLFIYIINKFI